MGHAVKIIEIAEGNQTFSLNEGALKKILHDVPEGMEIAIVSVVSCEWAHLFGFGSVKVLRVGDNSIQETNRVFQLLNRSVLSERVRALCLTSF